MHDVLAIILMIGQDDEIGVQNQIALLSFILKHSKMKSLFNTSLEMDKILFVERTFQLLKDEDCFPKTYMTK